MKSTMMTVRRGGLRRRRRLRRHVHGLLLMVAVSVIAIRNHHVSCDASPPPPSSSSVLGQRAGSTDISSGSTPTTDDNQAGADQQHESIIFEGTFECESEQIVTLHKGTSTQDLVSFFKDHRNRDVLLKGGGNQVDPISLTNSIVDEWTRRSKLVDSTPPRPRQQQQLQQQQQQQQQHNSKLPHLWGGTSNHHHRGGSTTTTTMRPDASDEEVLAIHSDAAICPGLSIDAVSYTGCKLTVDPRTSIPQYEFTLLHDTYTAKGLRPMVGIFDRVTGADSRSRQQKSTATKSPVSSSTAEALQGAALIGNVNAAIGDHGGSRKTYALSRVTLRPEVDNNSPFRSGGGGGGGSRGGSSLWDSITNRSSSANGGQGLKRCRVSYYGRVKVECKLPKSFLGFLPVPKHKVEEKVSKSIAKQLEKEGLRSVQQFAERLEKWAQDKDSGRTNAPYEH